VDVTDSAPAAGGMPLVHPVHAAVPGRARFAVAGLYHDGALAQMLEGQLRRRSGILAASASSLTGKVLVLFDPALSLEQVRARIEEAIARARRSRGNGIAHNDERARGNGIDERARGNGIGRDGIGAEPDVLASIPDDDAPAWHRLPAKTAMGLLESSPDAGLRQAEAAERLRRFGANRLPGVATRSGFEILTEQFNNLPVALLGVSAALALVTGGILEAVAIACVVGLNASIGYATESEAERTINALTDDKPPPATVLRSGRWRQIPVEELVPGDVIGLAPGVMIPADARLIEAHRLTIDESALTGESLPVPKSLASLKKKALPLADRSNLVFMGTTVAGGSGRALVVATGAHTQLGLVSAMVGQARAPTTPLQRQLEGFARKLVVLSLGICGVVFAVGLLRGYGLLPMIRSSISLAIAAVPEGLPAIATTTLALGIGAMRRRKVLIRQLSAVETLGALQVICFDKTGTITFNRMKAVGIADGANGHSDPAELTTLLKVGVLCSDAAIEEAEGTRVVNGSPTETALVQLAAEHGLDVKALRRSHPLVRIEHRAERKHFMATMHESVEGNAFVAVKGNPTEVLSLCESRMENGRCTSLSKSDRAAILAENDRMGAAGLRVLGMAYAERPAGDVDDPDRLCWLGLVGLADPIRPRVRELIESFHAAGIRTVMVTGDQPATARAVAKELGLNGAGALDVVDAEALGRMNADELREIARKTPVFARVSPSHKLEIVRALQSAGQVTAMTGDGINDGPALKAADIGVAMGRAGTNLARQTASVILEDDELSTMLEAIRRGRTIHGNIRRSIRFILATNLSEIMVVLAATAGGLGQPLQPLQLLWINLISDVFPSLALAVEPPEPEALRQRPRDPHEPIIPAAQLSRIAGEAAIISASALGAYGYGLARYGLGRQAGTIAFTSLIIGQLLHAWTCRSDCHGVFTAEALPPNRYLDAAVLGSLGLQAAALLIPGLRGPLGLGRLSVIDALVAGLGGLVPFALNELRKLWAENPAAREPVLLQ
jgi:Ca2+-transporting ATPase